MSITTFSTAPDSFFLSLPAVTEHLQFRPFETSWGTSDEILCYYGDTLIGQRIADSAATLVNLLPKLDRKRDYPWPSKEQFASALTNLLDKSPRATLRCEWDVDQHDVLQIDQNDQLSRFLDLVIGYCAGERNPCPSFVFHLRGG